MTFAEWIRLLRQQAHVENVRLALRTLADRCAFRGNREAARRLRLMERAPLLRTHRPPTLTATLADLASLLRVELRQGLLCWEEMQAEVSAQFHYRRGGEVVLTHFSVGEELGLPGRGHLTPPAAQTPRMPRADGCHTLDVHRYIRNSIGDFLMQEVIHQDVIVELHRSSLEDTLMSLAARGFDRYAAVATPLRYAQVEILAAQRGAERRIIMAEIMGAERLYHTLLMLSMAGVEAARVELHQAPPGDLAGRFAEGLGTCAPHVIVGFKNTLIGELERRKQAVVARHTGNRLLDAARITALDACGRPFEVMLVRTPYGADMAGACARSLAVHGARQISLFGLAGGLGATASIGDVVVPDQYFDIHDRPVPACNGLLRRVSGGGRVRQVSSPLQETMAVVERFRGQRYDLVEMEGAGMAQALSAFSDVRFAAVHVVSDLPGTRWSLDAYHSATARSGIAEAVDLLLAHHGIADVVPLMPAPLVASTRLASA